MHTNAGRHCIFEIIMAIPINIYKFIYLHIKKNDKDLMSCKYGILQKDSFIVFIQFGI